MVVNMGGISPRLEDKYFSCNLGVFIQLAWYFRVPSCHFLKQSQSKNERLDKV